MSFPKDFYEGIEPVKGFDKELVRAAYNFAEKKHKGQLRKSGEPYINHPAMVAKILIELNMPASMVAAALLHDTIEDTETTVKELEREFGQDVANLVNGVTNLGKVDFSAYSKDEVEEAKAALKNENLRQLFMAMSEDARVVIIKLADRLHNMRTLKYLNKPDRIRIARETLNIFAPLALRLGMGEIKGELEDLAFPIAYENEYKELKNEANRRFKAGDRYVVKVKRYILDKLKNEGIEAEIQGRAKHLYSLYKKLNRPEIAGDFDKVYDLVALRILTDNVGNCYRILGTVHAMYRPMPNYIRDYIAAPKPNGYRSIHTTVFGPEGKLVEIQIRTREMHEEAEFGIASHLHYTQEKSKGATDEALSRGTFAKSEQTDFLKQIKEWQNSVGSANDFVEGLKMEFLDDRIYVFSPKGDIYDLPTGATPIDFAYEVHSGIGDKCVGARINGKMVTLDSVLSTRDIVEILTSKNSAPKRDWLDFVKTSKAKQHIRGYFRKFDFDKNKADGQAIVAEELTVLGVNLGEFSDSEIRSKLSETSFKTIDDLYASVGAGLTTPRQAIKMILGKSFIPEARVKEEKPKPLPAKRQSFKGISIAVAPCCKPEKSDKIICYTTRGRGMTAHKKNCKNLKSLEKERLVEYNPWISDGIPVRLEVIGVNRVGMIRDVTGAISSKRINIEKMKNKHKGALSVFDLTVIVEEMGDAVELIKRLKEVGDVKSVKRVN